MKYLVSRYCDFQIHSPRDRRYFGWEKEQMTLAGLERWAEALLAECARRSIGSIAVTDHHDLWPGVIVLRKAHEIDATTWVFPGMEITSKSGIQAVLLIDPMEFGDMNLFDAGNTESVINRITASIGQNITAGPQGAKNLMVTPWTNLQGLASMKADDRARVFLGPDIERLDRDLEGEEGIAQNLNRVCRDRHLLLPNLEKNKQGVFGNEYGRAFYVKAEPWFVGGYVGGSNITDEDAIRGKKVKEFSRRVVVCLKTSDQRGKDAANWFSDRLGHPDCGSWLKLSEPTVNSVAQALISGREGRVFDTAPGAPLEFIETLEISGTDVFGPSLVVVPLSPHLSTLIGGRGTGKSLLLSALVRLFGTDQEWISKNEDERLPWEARHLALFSDGGPFFGSDVSITAIYRKESGVTYKLTLEAPGHDLLEHRKLEMKTSGGWQQIAAEEAALAALDFRPLFFLQNQMSAITGSRLEQQDLTNLIEGPIRAARASVRANLTELSSTVREGMSAKGKLKTLETHTQQLAAQIKQKESERKAFLEAAQKGLTPEQQALFGEGESLRKGKEAAGNLETTIEDALRALSTEYQDMAAARAAAKLGINGLLTSKLADFRADKYVSTLLEAANAFEKKLKALIDDIQKQLTETKGYKVGHQKVLEGLIGKAAEIAEKEKTRRAALKKAQGLEAEIAQLAKQQQKLLQESQRIQRSGSIEKAESALGSYRKLVKEYSEQLEQRARDISENDEFRLIVRIIPGGRFEGVVSSMRELCDGAGVRNSTWTQLEQILKDSNTPATVLTELFESMIRAQADSSDKLPRVWEQCGFSEKIFSNIRTRTTLEQWVEMSVLLADDKVVVMYKRGKGKKPIPILNASPGERAVELLKLALFSTTGPLVIDQPEDDLDNQFLAEQLVALIQDAKKKNQLIFASHNANVVVHGDSEAIHVMDAHDRPDGRVGCALLLSGTIDQQDVCRKIEEVMEGGREAFENRRRKYHETISA